MQRIIEPIMFIIYLTTILLISSYMIRESIGSVLYKSFGSFGLTLALADGIYIIPRMYAVLTTGVEENLRVIGWGRMGNSIIVTILFLILYDIFHIRYSKKKNIMRDKTIYVLGIIRAIICLLPGNGFFDLIPSPTYAIIRLVPILIIGIYLITVIFIHSKRYNDKSFKILNVALIVLLLLIEPSIFHNASISIYLLTIIRTAALNIILLIGYKELRDINVLSRY